MKEIFDNYIETSFDDFRQAEFKFDQFEFNYRKYFPTDLSASVLDIGIGRGEMLSCMKKWGYQNYLGVDISKSTVSFCSGLDLRCDLVDDVRPWLIDRPESFSIITLLDVLEHFDKKEVVPFLKAVRSALGDGGIVIIQVPNLQSPDGFLHRYNDITHEIGFLEHSLRQILIESGFRKFSFHGFEVNIYPGIKNNLDKFIRAIYWRFVHYKRRITTNLDPPILHPVLFAVARK